MVEIRLHGALAREFGRVWILDIATVQEAVQAIDANIKGFRRRIIDLADKGMVFRVRSKHHDYDNDDVHTQLGSIERVDIIPVIVGANANVRFVVGAVLAVVGYAYAQPYLISAGVGLMLGSVVEWLTPSIKREDNSNKALQSWSVSGPTNTVDQGLPVPVIYGEVLTGAYAISGGISASQLVNGAVTAQCLIGGTSEFADMTGGGGSFTSSVKLSVGVFNLSEPFTYSWSYTGFIGASAVRLTGAATPVIELQVDFSGLAGNTVTTYTGTVSVTVTGKSADNTGTNITVSNNRLVSVSMDTTIYVPPTGA